MVSATDCGGSRDRRAGCFHDADSPTGPLAQTEERSSGHADHADRRTALSPTSIELTWDPPMASDGGGVDAYRIDYSEDGMVWYSLESSYDSATYTDDFELSAREMRYYRVFAYNSTGSSDIAGPVSTSTDASEKAGCAIGPDTGPSLTDPRAASHRSGTPGTDQSGLGCARRPRRGAGDELPHPDVSGNGRSYTNLATVTAKKVGTCNTATDRECDVLPRRAWRKTPSGSTAFTR